MHNFDVMGASRYNFLDDVIHVDARIRDTKRKPTALLWVVGAQPPKETSERRMMPFGQYRTFFTVVVLPRTVVVVSTLVEPSKVTVKLEPGREVATFI